MTNKDKKRLIELANRQAELAHTPKMEKLRKEWEKHGNFDFSSRPMMTVELWTFQDEIIPPLMKCEEEEARKLEFMLLSNTVNHTQFGDDTIVKDYLPVYYDTSFKPFDIDVQVEETGGLGHQFVQKITDLEDDFHKLNPSVFSVDKPSLQSKIGYYHSIFGDVLPAKPEMGSVGFCPTQNIVHLMGMETMYMSMYDYPELFHKMMGQLTDDFLKYVKMLEKEGLLLPTAADAHLSQGSYCFNAILPKEGMKMKAKDVWLYMDSQESAGISPDMYAEFIAPYYKKTAEHFGLLSYGCCEAVDPIWDCAVSKYSNLQKVSISPWCNEEFMGEKLKGKNIVYLRKPFPNDLGVGADLDEEAVRAHIKKTVDAAQGCTLEFACRDVYSVNRNPDKVKRYVEIMRECCESHKK